MIHRKVHPHGEKGLHPPGEPRRTTRSPPPHPNRQATTNHSKGHHAGNGTGTRGGRGHGRGTHDGGRHEGRGTGPKRTPNAPEEATTPHPTEPGTPLGARTPRGHGTKTQAPREGNPTDTHLTQRAKRPTQTPAMQAQRAKPLITVSPDHHPATEPGPASHTTKRASLTSADPTPRQNSTEKGPSHTTAQRSTAESGATRHTAPQHTAVQHTTTRHPTTQHSTAHHSAARHSTAPPATPRQDTPQKDMAWHNMTEHSAPQHGTDHPGTARQSTAQHSTAHQGTPQHQSKGHQPWV